VQVAHVCLVHARVLVVQRFLPKFRSMKIASVAITAVQLVNGDGLHSSEAHAVNPIRKVVTLLQNMQKKVSSDAEKEKELYDKYMCYCKNGADSLAQSIEDAGNKVPALESSISESEAKLKQLKEDVKSHQSERSAAKAAVAQAIAVRGKENAEYLKESTELKTNIAAMGKAVQALQSGMGGSFLQSTAADTLKKFIMAKDDMQEGDRQEIVSFLTEKEFAPGTGEIVGILKQMNSEMQKDLISLENGEKEAVSAFAGLERAKNKEIQAATKLVESKLKRIGETGVAIVQMKNDLTDSGEALIEDKKFLKDLDKNCDSKRKMHEENVKARGQEMVALADTIKILNDDDALELFKKTLPGSASLLQTKANAKQLQLEARDIIQKAALLRRNPRFDFLALALHGSKIGFDKVIKMIDEMSAQLKQEQLDDEHKKEYCALQFDLAEDKKKSLEQSVSDLETSLIDAKDSISTLVGEIEALGDGLKTLDKEVADMTEQRQEESSDYTNLMASNGAAKEIMQFAKNRLNKFYNPKLYKEELVQASVGPAPEGPKEYKKSESSGVIHMIDLLIADLDKEMTQAEVTEKNAQQDYETFMSDSQDKRAEDSKSLTDKASTRADLETSLVENKDSKASTTKELMATEQYISSLHAECDWLLQYFDIRAEARAGELDGLKSAKAVLSGADFSLIQTRKIFLHRK